MMKNIFQKIINVFAESDFHQLIGNIAGNYIVKSGALIVSLFLTPAYMSYFPNQTVLGVWFTAISILNWLMLFDFGIGAGIRNQIVSPLERNDKTEIQQILSAGYYSVGSIVLLLLLGQAVVVEWIDWHAVFHISELTISRENLTNTIHILVIGVCIRFFTVLVNHVFYAMQRATIPGTLILLSNVIILLYMWIAEPTGKETDVINLAIVQALATNIPTFVATAILFRVKLNGCFPRLSALKMNRIRSILGTGTGLFYLQILITLLFGVKEILITWFAGAEQVVDYNVYLKLIGIVSSLFSLALTPVWSAVTKEYTNHRYLQIRKLYMIGMAAMAIFGLIQVVLIAFMPWLTKIWLGEAAIEISRSYAIVYAVYNLVYMWTMLNYNFACGMGRIKSISVCLTIAVVINVVLSAWWCSIKPMWILVVAATAVASIPCVVIVPRRILRF